MKRSMSMNDLLHSNGSQHAVKKDVSIIQPIPKMRKQDNQTQNHHPIAIAFGKDNDKNSKQPENAKEDTKGTNSKQKNNTKEKPSSKKTQPMEIPLPVLLQMMGGATQKEEEQNSHDINAPDEENGKTPLHYIVENGWTELIAPAILTGADPGAKDKQGNNVFHLAAKTNKPLALLSLYETVIKIASIAEKADKKADIPDSAKMMYM